MLNTLRAAPLVAALVTGTALCSPTYEGEPGVATGTWGGDHIGLAVTDNGGRTSIALTAVSTSH